MQSLLAELLKAAGASSIVRGSTSQRITAMMLALHVMMRDQMTQETRVHEIVQIAMDENWPPIVDYISKCAAMLGEAIAAG